MYVNQLRDNSVKNGSSSALYRRRRNSGIPSLLWQWSYGMPPISFGNVGISKYLIQCRFLTLQLNFSEIAPLNGIQVFGRVHSVSFRQTVGKDFIVQWRNIAEK